MPYVVASAAMWKIGQASPGETLGFTRVDAAIELRRALETEASAASLELVADPAAKVI